MNASTFIDTMRRQRLVVAVVLVIGLIAFLLAWPHFRKFTATTTMLASNAPSGSSGLLDPSRDPIASAVGLYDLQTLATSEIVLQQVAKKLSLPPEKAAKLPGEVKAKAIFSSDILPIAVTDADPKTAIDAANAIARELSAYSQHIATGRYDELISNLQGQIDQRKNELASVDRRIQEISSGDFYVTPETGTGAIDTRLIALAQQEQQLTATVEGDKAAADITAEQPGLSKGVARTEILAGDPSIVAQRAELGKDVAQVTVGTAGYSPNFPGLQSFLTQVQREAATVKSHEDEAAANPSRSAAYVTAEIASNRARAQLAQDSAQLDSVRAQFSELQAHLTGSSHEGSDVAELRRARAAGEQVFNDLSQRLARAKADRAQAASIGSVVIIDHAADASPALLGRPLVLGAAFAAIFIWLAITLAFLFDQADDRFRTPESIEKLYGKPVFMPIG